MCLYPTIIKNRKYVKNKKNGGHIPWAPDPRVQYVPVGCQNCIECRKQKAREWQVRLLEHIKTNTNGKFVTLTFSDRAISNLVLHTCTRTETTTGRVQKIPINELTGYAKDNAIATKATRLFLERWRKQYKKSLPHWLVTELGHKGTQNIHLHGIIWTNDITKLDEIWQYGFVWKGQQKNETLRNYVTARTINYIVKYITKIDHQHKEYKSKILTSPGIGGNYTNTINSKYNAFKPGEVKETYTTSTGHEIAMPIYWRNKIYTDRQREALWLQKLDKQERWVCKERVDISKGDQEYKTLVQWYRRINKELGYGTLPNENRKQYEELQRELQLQTRINRAKKL